MFYYLYQITNNLNGKIYVGVHKTKSIDDGYMGSGKVIRSAIAKHGIKNFTKVILEQFEDATAMYAREKEVVNEDFLLREDTYNLRRGGFGGFDHINKTLDLSERNRKTNANRDYTATNYGYNKIKNSSEWFISKVKEAKTKNNSWFIPDTTGFRHSNETKDKMRKLASGENSSQFGSFWVTNGAENQKVRSGYVIPDGWRRGRVL